MAMIKNPATDKTPNQKAKGKMFRYEGEAAVSPRRLMLVCNPRAGVKHGGDVTQKIMHHAEKLRYVDASGEKRKYGVVLRYTEHAGHASELAAQAASEGYYAVIACGGDGTVNEVATSLCGSETMMGIVPLGSGNGLARHLGYPMTIPGAFKLIDEDRPLYADFATANGRPFFCTFGLGFDAEVTVKFNRRPGRGLKNYLRTVFEEYLSYKSSNYTIISDGTQITDNALLVAICNASQYGNNAFIAPRASIKDGLLDITVIHNGNPLENVISGLEMLTGFMGNHPNSVTFRAREIIIKRNDEGPAHFDGEPAFLEKEITVKCHPGGLKVFSTDKKSKLRPVLAPEIPIISPMLLTVRDLQHKLYNIITK